MLKVCNLSLLGREINRARWRESGQLGYQEGFRAQAEQKTHTNQPEWFGRNKPNSPKQNQSFSGVTHEWLSYLFAFVCDITPEEWLCEMGWSPHCLRGRKLSSSSSSGTGLSFLVSDCNCHFLRPTLCTTLEKAWCVYVSSSCTGAFRSK